MIVRVHAKDASVNDCAIVVPIYKLPLLESEQRVLKRNLRTLSDWPVIFVLPKRLLSAWQQSKDIESLGQTFYFPDRFFASIDGYNKLLLDIKFYLRFHAFKNILICQLDAVVVRDELRQWCDEEYSYIGAPWFVGYETPTLPYQFLGALHSVVGYTSCHPHAGRPSNADWVHEMDILSPKNSGSHSSGGRLLELDEGQLSVVYNARTADSPKIFF